MIKQILLWPQILWLLVACGPDTIFLRPSLDTAAHHVSNGYALLDQHKLDDARREFERAKELDHRHVAAYVGIGIVYGRQGDVGKAMKVLDHARSMAASKTEKADVARGYEQLRQMKGN
ncbi:MAG: hypothetical protein HKP58_03365 [Desulfatitalea sp.]|nr:hypothetical protein [Desulfatitalea sp.]NNJ99431.1 hypothetical protein [Desulfatitalea sp.]